MSLFRLVEWVSQTIPNTSTILNASFFQDREQLVIGGENGQITISDPGFRDTNAHVLCTTETKYAILQMASDNFLPSMNNILAVLSPTKLTYYKVHFASPDETLASLDEIFSHSFSTSAWNMCVIPIEESTPQILVQSIDCKLSLFQGDQCVFSMVPLRALQPGPIGYCQTTQTLFVANNGFLAAIKFSLMSSGSQKKINYDWSFNLGDTAIQMKVTEGSKPTTIVLCRRHVSAFNATGSVVWQIRLEAVGMAMCLYRSLLINNTQFNRLIVSTSDDTLLIFQDNKLVWNCNAQMSPVALLVCSYNKSYENTITMMAPDGKVVVGYLGTEPNLYRLPEDKVIVNYAERMEEYKRMEQKIKESDAAGGAIKRKEGIQMKLSIGEIGKRTIEPNAASNAPYCNLIVEFSEVQNVSKLHINILSECASPSKQVILNVGTSKSTASIEIPFYVGSKKSPTSNKVTIAAHCAFTQLTVTKSIDLPFKVLFEESQIDRNAKYKVTIDTAGSVMPLNKLFSEFESENPQAIGFSLHGSDKTVSVFAANKSNRYRIQSEHISLLQITSRELVKRIAESAPGIEIGGVIPFEYMRETLDEIQELQTKKKEDSKKIDCRTKEVRAIEALSLNSCKTGNMGNLPSLDALFDKSYRELLDAMDSYNSLTAKIENQKASLNSLFQLAADLSKLSKVDTILNGSFWANTQQSLRDRLRWAVKTDRGNEMTMIEKLCEHSPKELPKIREEEEEEEQQVTA
ncbi:Protein pthb1 homolog [Caenorhabditis elegans]|uniref:Protein pthb1 homolog n=1 Tax=Caenorhabditis elegans TaxID=6239 RepID=PTHB1_CAEEL|nr:Protein pthb1 homolog [Caenorhabditis elegans]O01514.5 RecName: Full=Protein pthb1 homolog; AltName: Full=Bardet-Biedl syndrome 9 protein homolog [Caenorhabditis elegans]CCD67585.2 Protein pthb1 homolog [Caenorhabditis elegans]|eukprot:NP_491973.4 Protein pthb1 homolog [Caenorhabditis elegans]